MLYTVQAWYAKDPSRVKYLQPSNGGLGVPVAEGGQRYVIIADLADAVLFPTMAEAATMVARFGAHYAREVERGTIELSIVGVEARGPQTQLVEMAPEGAHLFALKRDVDSMFVQHLLGDGAFGQHGPLDEHTLLFDDLNAVAYALCKRNRKYEQYRVHPHSIVGVARYVTAAGRKVVPL